MKKLLSVLLVLVMILFSVTAVAATTPDLVHVMRALTVINYNYQGRGYAYYDEFQNVIQYVEIMSLTSKSDLHGYYTLDDILGTIDLNLDTFEQLSDTMCSVLTEVIENYVSPAYTVPAIVVTHVLIDEEEWVHYLYSNHPELSPFYE